MQEGPGCARDFTYLGSNGIEICGPSPQAEIDFVKHIAGSQEPHDDLITFAAHTLLEWTR